MSRLKNILGEKHGRLTVTRFVEIRDHRAYWECTCECGNVIIVPYGNLYRNHTQSCGCYAAETKPRNRLKHGESKTRLFRIWCGMHQRCENEKATVFSYYGKRGISVCEQWSDYEMFANWAKANGYEENLTIDRIDSNGNYTPNNCRWATKQQQSLNRKRFEHPDRNERGRFISKDDQRRLQELAVI